jgi:hypothetical protein
MVPDQSDPLALRRTSSPLKPVLRLMNSVSADVRHERHECGVCWDVLGMIISSQPPGL